MSDITLWGFDGSTYVRTVKMLLAEKGVTQFKQVPLNVLEGEPKSASSTHTATARWSVASRPTTSSPISSAARTTR